MFFVSDVPNNGQNVLDIMVTKPNRERQKLMREQNILKQVPVCTCGGWGGLHLGPAAPGLGGGLSRTGALSHLPWTCSLTAASLHPFVEN